MDEMNTAEVVAERVEREMIYKILFMINKCKENSEDIEQLEKKVEALLEK